MKHIFPINLFISLALAAVVLPGAQPRASADLVSPLGTQIDIAGPPGSGSFGSSVTVLPNGNVVVTDPYYDAGSTVDVGAAYLYDGASGTLISTLTGSAAGDQVGSSGVMALSNGHYVVHSPHWDNGAGAITWCSGTTGCAGTVSAANSLVGSSTGDYVGGRDVIELGNGDYVVPSPTWNSSAGAVTRCSSTAGCTGTVSAANSLVGSTANDRVGNSVTALGNGSYVVLSGYWDNGPVEDAGSATWCSGTANCIGPVSETNSLVGSSTDDEIGGVSVTVLSDGDYVVRSPYWDNGLIENAGAATWCGSTAGCTGTISTTNSLVGSTANDQVGFSVRPLSSGDYVVLSAYWDNGSIENAGAVTWCSSTVGCTGPVSEANSLVGSTNGDRVGYMGMAALSNGNYVVLSTDWDNDSIENAGAVTWCSSTVGCTGPVSVTNSLVGSAANDWVGGPYREVTELSNGDYVVVSPSWNNGSVENAGAVTRCSSALGCTGPISVTNSLVGFSTGDYVGGGSVTALNNGSYVVSSPNWENSAGAVTWCSGAAGCTGVVTFTNSLAGSSADDRVGYGVTALSNGNYVVRSFNWDNDTTTDVGAVTWCSGTAGCVGPVSEANSLVGFSAEDQAGIWGAIALDGVDYVVLSLYWDNGEATDAGAATWCSGTAGCTGAITATNSLVGATDDDRVGYNRVTSLRNGSYVVSSPYWDNGIVEDAGAVTWCIGPMGCIGPVTAENSVRGATASGGSSLVFAYDPVNFQLVVGRPADNIVTLFRPYQRVFVPLILR